jgi:hypothetical protein
MSGAGAASTHALAKLDDRRCRVNLNAKMVLIPARLE